jgi:hypothetical protein
MTNHTREERISQLKKKFGSVRKTNTTFKDTVDDIIADMRMRENEAKQYDEAQEFMEHQEHNEYK